MGSETTTNNNDDTDTNSNSNSHNLIKVYVCYTEGYDNWRTTRAVFSLEEKAVQWLKETKELLGKVHKMQRMWARMSVAPEESRLIFEELKTLCQKNGIDHHDLSAHYEVFDLL